MRARNIKPGFFKNDDLAECSPMARLLFIGLWCMADREGRMELRPKRIKAEIFPYENCKIEVLLDELRRYGFIVCYQCEGQNYLSIPTFTQHQNCHVKEAESTIPAPCESDTCTVLVGPLTESLLLNPESPLLKTERGGKAAKPPKPPPPQKVKYLDSVFLTEIEYRKLQEALGQKSLEVGIEKLDYSITVKNGKYHDHYKTILNWHKRGFLTEEENNGKRNGNDSGSLRKHSDDPAIQAILDQYQ